MAPRKVIDPETGQSWDSVKACAEALDVSREALHRNRLQKDDGGHYVLLPAPRPGRKITTRFDLPDERTVYGWTRAQQALGIDRAALTRRLHEVGRGHYIVKEAE